jgi:hypothetical protein
MYKMKNKLTEQCEVKQRSGNMHHKKASVVKNCISYMTSHRQDAGV